MRLGAPQRADRGRNPTLRWLRIRSAKNCLAEVIIRLHAGTPRLCLRKACGVLLRADKGRRLRPVIIMGADRSVRAFAWTARQPPLQIADTSLDSAALCEPRLLATSELAEASFLSGL